MDLLDSADGIHVLPDDLIESQRLLRKRRGGDAQHKREASGNPKGYESLDGKLAARVGHEFPARLLEQAVL
jgi:hypothetical protein